MLYNLLDFTIETVHATSACSLVLGKIRNDMPAPISHYISQNEKVTTVVDADRNIVFSWGRGDTKCLGHDGEDDVFSPQPLTLSVEENISLIVTGSNHVLAFNTTKSCIYAWGNYSPNLATFISPKDFTNGTTKNGVK